MARVLLVGVLAAVVGAGSFVGALLAAPIDFALAPPPTSALLLSDDGRQIAALVPPERREDVAAADIPEVMREAMISAEDERFLDHSGVDPLATVRAAFRDLTGGISQGGSTLTQQYVKNAYVGNDRTASRKILEAAVAVRLERKLTKQQILTDYLNALYLGNGLYGVQAAAKYYFGVPVKDLALDTATGQRDDTRALARAAMLAGLAPAPSAWNPVADFKTARFRQQYTLNRMVVNNLVTSQQASDAFQVDVKPLRQAAPIAASLAPEFADYVGARLRAPGGLGDERLFRGGVRVLTTLDLDLQTAFAQALKEVLPDVNDPQAAMVAVDYRNGDIKAMSGLRRVPEKVDGKGNVIRKATDGYQRDGFNVATNAHRSTGSTIKTFTLAQALASGKQLTDTRYGPARDSIPCPDCKPDPYVYGNSDDKETGTFTLRRALALSVNTVYVPLAIEVGRDKVARLAEKAGLAPPMSLKSAPLSFGLGGGVDVTPLAEAVSYGTFAEGGVSVRPRSWTEIRAGGSGSDDGQVIEREPASARVRVVSPSVAADVVSALTDVVTYGTATAAQQPFTVFGKTGTTDNSTDAWFTGCIPDQHICVATWMGYDDASCASSGGVQIKGGCGSMTNIHGVSQVYGGTLPAKLFARSQEILRGIKADRAARAAGPPATTPAAPPAVAPAETARPFRSPTAASSVAPTLSLRPTRGPVTTTRPSTRPTSGPTPSPTRSRPVLLPSRPPPTTAPVPG